MPGEVTRLLRRWRDGDRAALDELIPIVYQELRRLARAQMRNERAGHTLQPTALVHEAYTRLGRLELDWQDRAHFLSMAARTMRRVLVEHARARRAVKRGGGAFAVTLTDNLAVEPDVELERLDDALRSLGAHDARAERVLELFYFGGLTHREIAAVLEISATTVDRELRFGRAWLRQELEGEPARGA